MSVLKYSLITLPIHHYSYKRYYERHDRYVEKEKKEDINYGVPFDELSEENKLTWERLWWWPPWKYNDIVGFLEIGMDIGDHMTADIYLQRKYLPRQHPNKKGFNRRRVSEYLYYREILKRPVCGKEKSAYLDTFHKIIKDAKSAIRKRNRYFELFIYGYSFDCIDLSKAHQQLMEARERQRRVNGPIKG